MQVNMKYYSAQIERVTDTHDPPLQFNITAAQKSSLRKFGCSESRKMKGQGVLSKNLVSRLDYHYVTQVGGKLALEEGKNLLKK